jgi:hypothetical protein
LVLKSFTFLITSMCRLIFTLTAFVSGGYMDSNRKRQGKGPLRGVFHQYFFTWPLEWGKQVYLGCWLTFTYRMCTWHDANFLKLQSVLGESLDTLTSIQTSKIRACLGSTFLLLLLLFSRNMFGNSNSTKVLINFF